MILISISTNFDRLHLIKRGHICSGMPKNALFPSIRNFNKSIKEKIEKTNSGQILKFIYRRIAFRNMFSISFIDEYLNVITILSARLWPPVAAAAIVLVNATHEQNEFVHKAIGSAGPEYLKRITYSWYYFGENILTHFLS